MASALIEELKTVATEAKKNQIEDAVGSSWAALAADQDPQGRGIGTLLVEAGAGGGEGRGRGRGGGGRRGHRGGGVRQQVQLEDPLATQSDGGMELSQTNRGVGGVCVGVVPREGFNDWGGRGYDDFIPGRSPKQPLPRMRLHDPPHGRQASPEFIAFDQGVDQICPR